MKKQLFTVVFFIAFASTAMAQSTAIKINVLSPIVRTLNLSVEQKIMKQGSLQIGFFYTDLNRNDQGFTGIGITPEFRYYLGSTEAINGFYIAPFLRYNKVTMKVEVTDNGTTHKVEADLNGFGGGVVVGKQWVFKERITIDIFAGPKGMSHSLDIKSGTDSDFKNNIFGSSFGLRAGVTFGIAF